MLKTKEDYQKAYVIEQLKEFGYYDVEDKSYRDLVAALSRLRALEIKESEWF